MAEQSPLDWLMSDQKVNPGALDTDNLDEEIKGRLQAVEGADSLKWLYDGDMDTALTENRGPVSPPRESGFLDVSGRIARDLGRGMTEIVPQAIGGARDAIQEMNDLADQAGDWLTKNVADLGSAQIFDKEGNLDIRYFPPGTKSAEETGVTLPNVDPADSNTGNVIRNVSQFLTGFVTAGKALKGVEVATRTGKTLKAMVQGAASDFTAFDGHQTRLANLVQSVPSLQNPVTEFLQANPEDGEIEGRLKNAIEGAGLGAAAEGLVWGLRLMRSMKNARAASAAATGRANATILQNDPLAVLRTAGEMNLLGDEKAPLFSKAMGKLKTAAKETALPVPEDVAAKGLTRSGAIGGEEAFVNFARINTADDVKSVIGQMADAYAGDLSKARRGVQTNAQTIGLADQEDAWKILMERRKGQPLNAEQSYAVRQLWTTAAGKLKDISEIAAREPTPENLFQFRRMLAVTQAVQKEAIGARTETARALQQWAIPVGGQATKFKGILDAIDQSGGMEVSAELAKRITVAAQTDTPLSTMMAMIEKGPVAKTLDAVHEIWINGLLSGPKTHIVNALSNSSVIGLSVLERGVAARISGLLGDEGVEAGEALAQMAGLKAGFQDALRNAGKAFRSGQTGYGVNKLETARTRAISSTALNLNADSWVGMAADTLGAAVNIPGRALQTADEFFKTLGYRMELWSLAHRSVERELRTGKLANDPAAIKDRMADLIQNPPETMHLASSAEAAYRTFTNEPGDWTKTIMRARSRVPGMRWVLPFVNTPSNILKYTFERTPLAPLMSTYRTAIARGGADAQIARSRMAIGSLAMMTAADWAMDDRMTGSGPPAGPERDNWFRQGYRPYSIRVGDTWVAYNRFDPIGYLLGMSADIAEYAKNADFDDETFEELQEAAAAAAFSVAENISSKSYLQGVSTLAEAMTEPDRFGAAYFERLLGSFMPSGAAEVARQLDPVQRVSYDMLTSLQRRTPGWSKDLPPRRDLWGRERTYESGLGTTYDVLSPMYGSKMAPEPIDLEMQKQHFYIGMPQKGFSVDGEFVSLKNMPQAYSRYLELAGNTKPSAMKSEAAQNLIDRFGDKTLLEALNDVVTGKDPEWSEGYRETPNDPEEKESYLFNRVIRHYRNAARDQVLEEFPTIRSRAERIKTRRLESVQ